MRPPPRPTAVSFVILKFRFVFSPIVFFTERDRFFEPFFVFNPVLPTPIARPFGLSRARPAVSLSTTTTIARAVARPFERALPR